MKTGFELTKKHITKVKTVSCRGLAYHIDIGGRGDGYPIVNTPTQSGGVLNLSYE